jgi:hypothetical protein
LQDALHGSSTISFGHRRAFIDRIIMRLLSIKQG